MIRHTAIVSGRLVAYWERNPQAKVTIVLLHGFRGNHSGLIDLAAELSQYRIIMPDLPGYGESAALKVRHTLPNYARWLDDFIAAIGLHEWISAGHSYSGSIALMQAAHGKHRPMSLICINLAAVRDDPTQAVATAYYRIGRHLPPRLQQLLIVNRAIDHATGRWLFTGISRRRRHELVERGDTTLSQLHASVVTDEYLSSLAVDLRPLARANRVPTLVIAGRRDIIVPVRRLADLVTQMPNGHLSIVVDGGHLAPLEEPGTCATLIRAFLSRPH